MPSSHPSRGLSVFFLSFFLVAEERVDLSNDMTWRQMIGVGVRRVVLARGELDELEGPKYAARRAELRRKAREAARTRERRAAASSQNEAEESDATEEEFYNKNSLAPAGGPSQITYHRSQNSLEEESTRERTTRVGRPRGGMKVAAKIGEGLRREIIGRDRRPRVGDG